MIFRHSLIRRWKVLSWLSAKRSGYFNWSRFSRFLAVMSGSWYNQSSTSYQTPSNASLRVRQYLGFEVFFRWVGLTSPSCHNLGNWVRNFSRLSRWGLCLEQSADARALNVDWPWRIPWSSLIGSSFLRWYCNLCFIWSFYMNCFDYCCYHYCCSKSGLHACGDIRLQR